MAEREPSLKSPPLVEAATPAGLVGRHEPEDFRSGIFPVKGRPCAVGQWGEGRAILAGLLTSQEDAAVLRSLPLISLMEGDGRPDNQRFPVLQFFLADGGDSFPRAGARTAPRQVPTTGPGIARREVGRLGEKAGMMSMREGEHGIHLHGHLR